MTSNQWNWSDFGLIGDNSCISFEEIKQIESILDIKFPTSYKDLVNYANPAYIEIGCFDYDLDNEGSISDFFPLTISHDHDSVLWHSTNNEHVPKGVVPFARDAGDFLICFDYRESKLKPKIVFLDPFSQDLWIVSDDFESFLKILRA